MIDRLVHAFPLLLFITVPLLGAGSFDGLAIIDAHVHVEESGATETGRAKIAEFRRQAETAGVVAAVSILHTDDGTVPQNGLTNLLYCAGVRETPDLEHLETGLREHRYGCIKIYTGYAYRYAADPVFTSVYRLAAKYDVPVVFHTGDTSTSKGKLKYADPLTIDEVAVDHPDVTFVIAHCGNPWIESAAEVAYKNPNVFLDGSAFLVGDVSKMPREKVDEFVVRPLAWVFGYVEDPSKLMFGTDWPLVDIPAYVEAFKRAIPKEHWQKVFHDNAVRVFRLEAKAEGVTRKLP